MICSSLVLPAKFRKRCRLFTSLPTCALTFCPHPGPQVTSRAGTSPGSLHCSSDITIQGPGTVRLTPQCAVHVFGSRNDNSPPGTATKNCFTVLDTSVLHPHPTQTLTIRLLWQANFTQRPYTATHFIDVECIIENNDDKIANLPAARKRYR